MDSERVIVLILVLFLLIIVIRKTQRFRFLTRLQLLSLQGKLRGDREQPFRMATTSGLGIS